MSRDFGTTNRDRAVAALLAARRWLTIEWLPAYAPELNAIEHRWRDLKQHHLANRTFADGDDLDRAIHRAVNGLNHERQPHSSASFSRAA